MRCAWCGKRGGDIQVISCRVKGPLGIKEREVQFEVHAKHKRQLESYINRYNRYGLFYVGSIAALTLALVVSYAVSAVTSAPIDRLTGLIVCAMGALIAILPFATPSTVGALGIRPSRAIVRVLGAIIMIGAFVTLVL